MHRGRRVEDWVELTAAAIKRSRAEVGDEEVARRSAEVIDDADRETVVRVLRMLGRELTIEGRPDLTGLDARLREGAAFNDAEVDRTPDDAEHDAPTTGETPNEKPRHGQTPARPTIRPADLAKQLARLRNPILPHPRRRPGSS